MSFNDFAILKLVTSNQHRLFHLHISYLEMSKFEQDAEQKASLSLI